MPQPRKSPAKIGWREQWLILSYYQRFEAFVAFVLTLVIALVIVVALYRLSSSVVTGLLFGALDPLEQRVFQTVFGEVLTLLIALEFNHTLQYVVRREQSIIQTRVVLLIALLAVSRKLIVFDLHDIEAPEMLGLAAITIALAGAYWLVRDRDDRAGTKSDDPVE